MARWIKIYDGLLEWGWHTRPEMVSLFVHLLIRANVKDGFFLGIKVRRGEFVTSRAELSKLTGISEQTIRTCLKNLQETGEIIVKSTKRYTVITICKYDDYQQRPTDHQPTTNQQLTNNQPTTNQQLTTSIEYKNIDNKIEEYNYCCCYWEDLSESEKQQEQQDFLEIFFFKNYQNPGQEVERFVASNTSNLWKNRSGKTYATREQRLSLAKLWKQMPVQEPRIKLKGFLPIWRACYERCKQENPEIAKLFLLLKTTCEDGKTYGHPESLVIRAARPVIDWLNGDESRLDMITTPMMKLAKSQRKESIRYFCI